MCTFCVPFLSSTPLSYSSPFVPSSFLLPASSYHCRSLRVPPEVLEYVGFSFFILIFFSSFFKKYNKIILSLIVVSLFELILNFPFLQIVYPIASSSLFQLDFHTLMVRNTLGFFPVEIFLSSFRTQ